MTETQKHVLIAAIVITSAVIVSISIFTIIAHATHRSVKAMLIDLFFRTVHVKRIYKKSGYDKYMSKLDNSSCPRPKKLKSVVKKHEFCGKEVYTIAKSDTPDRIIIYLHGGAYIRHGTKYSWFACDKIVQSTNSFIIYPLYPLSPQNNYAKAYTLLRELYEKTTQETDKPVIIMGDSAGGGLAFGFCEHLPTLHLPQPSTLITFSPWLDITLCNDKISEIEPKDPMLASYGAKEIGKLWAGNTDPTDYKLSPIYGDVSELKNVYMFAGTREILYPDVVLMYDKLISVGVNATLYTGVNMSHDYPLYPMPEAKKAIATVCDIIKDL